MIQAGRATSRRTLLRRGAALVGLAGLGAGLGSLGRRAVSGAGDRSGKRFFNAHHAPKCMKSKIGLVTLGVCDLQKSLSFYRDGLGFRTHNYIDGEDHAMFVMKGTWLSLYPRDKLAADATVPNDGAGFPGVILAHNVGSKEQVEAVFAQAVGSGATAIKPPQDVYWGGYHAYFADLDRYLWEVAYNPFTDLT